MYNFTVKSKIHDYNVDFITNIEDSFSKQLIESDFIIIDKDIMNCNEYDIPYIKVLKTFSDGKQVF